MPPRHPKIAHALGLARQTLRQVADWGPNSPLRVLVACSGGADSVALLGLLHLLAEADGIELAVGHVDHGLRPDSGTDAEHVVDLGRQLGIPVRVQRLQLEAGAGLAARARCGRRAALEHMARERGSTALALGHTASDQAETVVLHLCRGAGLDGLSAMARCDAGPTGLTVLRPLLDLPRDEVRELATKLELPFVDDPTNEDLQHPRVFIRREVLPRLATLREGVQQSIAAVADRAREADDALAAWVATQTESRRTADGFDVVGMDTLPRAVRARWIRFVGVAGGVDADALGRRVIDQIDAAIVRPGRPRAWDLRPHRRMRLVGGRLWVEPGGADRATNRL